MVSAGVNGPLVRVYMPLTDDRAVDNIVANRDGIRAIIVPARGTASPPRE